MDKAIHDLRAAAIKDPKKRKEYLEWAATQAEKEEERLELLRLQVMTHTPPDARPRVAMPSG